ncbi:MAG TPA: DUF5916 domain-containing protein [Gammaproteobacteria bacterium]|nr:DUF5916 domain-containing protein [Gammaproteobacteria bacterium]
MLSLQRKIRFTHLTRMRIATLLLALAAALPAAAQNHLVAEQVAPTAIHLDGRLTEAAWQKADAIHLTQAAPKPGQPTPFTTTVRVLRNGQHLYFGIVCHDPHPADIAIHTLQRDAYLGNDDNVVLTFDTFGGGRIGYWFQVNAGGARADGLISAGGNTDNNWDGIWDAAVQRTADGWTAEIVIATRSLQFRSSLTQWGFNVERYIPRKQLTLRWTGINLNASVYDLHRSGALAGVTGLAQGVGLDVAPYALVRHDSNPGSGRNVEAGVDIRYNFTPQLEGLLTVNPDFAEAEAEHAQINLGRFSLFFPEKRAFFLEGSNQFTFSNDLRIGDDGNLSTGFIPYFSRRIGLVNGHIVPINEGVKLVGHAGRFSVGALDVETRNTAFAPANNLFVGRVAYNATDQLRVGTLVTSGDPTGQTDNTFAGFDTYWHTSRLGGDKNLDLSAWYAETNGDLPAGQNSGYGVDVMYPNDLWVAEARVNVYGDSFQPKLGFLPRPGTRQYLTLAVYRPRPKSGAFGWVRQFQLGGEYIQVDDLEGRPQSKELAIIPLRFTADSGYYFSAVTATEYERLDQPFEIVPGVTIPADEYRFTIYNLQGNTPDAWPWQLFAGVQSGHFYGGTLHSENIELDWTTLDGRLTLTAYNENDFGDLPGGTFIQRLDQLGASYSFTPNLLISTFAQYNTAFHKTGINARLEWIIQPGKQLFVVFNHGIEPQIANVNANIPPPVGNEVIVKLVWDFHW